MSYSSAFANLYVLVFCCSYKLPYTCRFKIIVNLPRWQPQPKMFAIQDLGPLCGYSANTRVRQRAGVKPVAILQCDRMTTQFHPIILGQLSSIQSDFSVPNIEDAEVLKCPWHRVFHMNPTQIWVEPPIAWMVVLLGPCQSLFDRLPM